MRKLCIPGRVFKQFGNEALLHGEFLIREDWTHTQSKYSNCNPLAHARRGLLTLHQVCMCITDILMNLHDKYCQHSLNPRRKGHNVHVCFAHTINGSLEIRAKPSSPIGQENLTLKSFTCIYIQVLTRKLRMYD